MARADDFDEGGECLVVFDGFEGKFKEVAAGFETAGLAFLKVVGTYFANCLRFSLRTSLRSPVVFVRRRLFEEVVCRYT